MTLLWFYSRTCSNRHPAIAREAWHSCNCTLHPAGRSEGKNTVGTLESHQSARAVRLAAAQDAVEQEQVEPRKRAVGTFSLGPLLLLQLLLLPLVPWRLIWKSSKMQIKDHTI